MMLAPTQESTFEKVVCTTIDVIFNVVCCLVLLALLGGSIALVIDGIRNGTHAWCLGVMMLTNALGIIFAVIQKTRYENRLNAPQ